MERIIEEGYVGSFHCALAHKSVSIREALKIPEGKAAVDKEWENSIKFQHER